jgi:hypothetical protein
MTPSQFQAMQEKAKQHIGYFSYVSTFADSILIHHNDVTEIPYLDFGVPTHVYRRDFIGPNGQIVAASISRYDLAEPESFKETDLSTIHSMRPSGVPLGG